VAETSPGYGYNGHNNKSPNKTIFLKINPKIYTYIFELL
jgi:hypothetical protein